MMNEKVWITSLITIGVFSLIVLFGNKLNSQNSQITKLHKTLIEEQTQNQKEILFYKEQLASVEAQIKTLLNKPTQVEYRTQYVQEPTPYTNTNMRCNSNLLGGQTCTSDTGERINCTPNGIGGMNCRGY